MSRITSTPMETLLIDHNPSVGDHVVAKYGVGPAVAGFGIGNALAAVVVIPSGGRPRFGSPAADFVLPIPMVVPARPNHQGDIPALSGAESAGEVGCIAKAIG